MSLPMDFWKNDQQLNIFRSKPCDRLSKGFCPFKSQCQYSHSLQTPRRPPQKHKYNAEICSEIRVTHGPNGEVQLLNGCTLGQKCELAHSKEEVLWHPDLFKTVLCEAFPDQRQKNAGKNGKRNQCHRYYCPFAHGQQELRPSTLSEDRRRQLIRQALDTFPSSTCCQVCVPDALPGFEDVAKQAGKGKAVGYMPSNGHVPQHEVTSPQRYWPPVNNQALQDGQGDSKNQFLAPPYLQQQIPPNAQLVAVRQWVPSPDQPQFQMAAQGVIANEGCAMVPVVPGHQMPQEVVGQPTNSHVPSQTPNASYSPPVAPGAQQPQQQMIPVMMSSPMGCGTPAALPMVQLTPPGQFPHNGGMGSLQMVPVTSVNSVSNAGHDNGAMNSSEVAKILRSAGLDSHVEIFKQNGLLDLEPEAIAAMQADQLLLRPVDHKRLLEEIRGMQQKAQSSRGNMVMMPSSAPRTPNMPPQLVMVNSADMYGQWMAASSPGVLNNEGLQPYCYPQMGTPWGNSNGMAQQHPQMMQFVPASVPGDQRSVQTSPQAVSPQDVPHVQFFPQQALPQVPVFPTFVDQATLQQQGPQAIQMQQPNMQNGAPCSPPQQQQRSNAMGPPSSPQQSFNSSPDWAGAPPAWTGQQQQALPQMQPQSHNTLAQSNGRHESQQSLRTNEESFAIADKESNGHARTKLKNRNQKLVKESSHLKTVESLLENATPHILDMTELHRRLVSANIVFDSKLRQHLESAPNFVVHNQHITLSKYLHCPEVKHLLDDDVYR